MAAPSTYRKKADENDVLLEMAAATDRRQSPDTLSKAKGLYFEDGESRIDYVLVYLTNKEEKDEEAIKKEEEHKKKRQAFESNLVDLGLVLEPEHKLQNEKVERHYIKIHAPWKVLAREAENAKLKVPLQESDIDMESWHRAWGLKEKLKAIDPMEIRDATIEEKSEYFMTYFQRNHLQSYLGHENKDTFFDVKDRLFLVEQLLDKTRFGEGHAGIGISNLIYSGAYQAAYPLHEGPDSLEPEVRPSNDRQRLRCDWAQFKRIFKYQPYEAIKDYFGSAIGLYFAWLGFYTAWLVPCALAGLLVFLYGVGASADQEPVKDLCDSRNKANWTMCPLCDRQCDYWNLTDSCLYARVTYWFDNEGALAIALFTSIWATLFLEFWKRRQVVLAHEWHVDGFEEGEEQLRPEYVALVTRLKRNPVTGKMEPREPKGARYRRLAVVASIITFMILLVLACVIGVIVYRAAVFSVLSAFDQRDIRLRAKMITSGTAAVVNLIAINILKIVYNRLALWLTEWENPRTRTDYEDSFTYKMYLFQFVNTYSSIFYIAFFKSDLVVGTPSRYKRVSVGGRDFRFEGCSAQGCFLELCIQLLVLMVGQQVIGNVTEILLPFLKTWWKRRNEPPVSEKAQYERDYDLDPLPDHYMFWEYLEVVLQFGFVIMFVSAFPLAPLFAMMTAILELRVDAVNFVSQNRRPWPAVAEDIGAWQRILEGLTRISVLVNAFVLSFTSDFVPKLLYRMRFNKDEDTKGTLVGYLDNTLSSIATSALKFPPENPVRNYTVCQYRGYFDDTAPYKQNKQYWHLIAARLAFVFVFQYTVYMITNLIAWLIPDKPQSLQLKIKREQYLAKEALRELPLSPQSSKKEKSDQNFDEML